MGSLLNLARAGLFGIVALNMRIEISCKKDIQDGREQRLRAKLTAATGVELSFFRIVDVYLVKGVAGIPDETLADIFCDPVAQDASLAGPVAADYATWDGAIEIAYKAGVTDPVAITAREALSLEVGGRLPGEAVVQQARQYLVGFANRPADSGRALAAVSAALHNPLIQQSRILKREDFEKGQRFPEIYPTVALGRDAVVEHIDLAVMSDDQLQRLSEERLLALTIDEMRCIRDYYADPATVARRAELGLPAAASDIELEMLAQSWSEHCKHKIFAAEISYRVGAEKTAQRVIRGVFREFIKKTTEDLSAARPDLLSVFHDNSGVVEFDDEYVVCFKVETHNSPSALDPYGGAITGIVGVNRDILGTGRGAWPFFNTNVLCFGYPDTPAAQVPPGLLHPTVVMEGVHEGIIDGGNQSGIPVAAGAFVFDESYLGKPLVFCGTGGIMPRQVRGKNSWDKEIAVGDRAVMVGGRIGVDGIHGATFSSLELDSSSPSSAVQIGDPITQRKMMDFLLEARDRGLFRGITDNGAGGLSSSFGEMATYTNGIRIELDKAPLKYPGLLPWEIWVSESQERMSLAVAPETLDEFMALAETMGVEAADLGEFTSSGSIELLYKGRLVGLLPLDFVSDGLPQMKLEARWTESRVRRPLERNRVPAFDEGALDTAILDILSTANIRSKEELVRQYDHEVQGGSAGKPFLGIAGDGPSDGGILAPVPGSKRGVTVTHGICPRVGDDDTLAMAQLAVDEAYRSHIALGGDPLKASALDNFCWPDPVQSPGTPDGEYKLAQLVRASQGLREICLAYTLPLISGKDSMKNDVRLGGVKVSVRPTLLVSLIGITEDIELSPGSDFKQPDDVVYVIGPEANLFGRPADDREPNDYGPFAFGGSSFEYLLCGRAKPSMNYSFAEAPHLGAAPRVSIATAPAYFRQVADCIQQGLFSSIHDCSDGGIAVAVAESMIGGRQGVRLDFSGLAERSSRVSGTTPSLSEILFNEEPSRFVVSVPRNRQREFEQVFDPRHQVLVGYTASDPILNIEGTLKLPLTELVRAWKTGWEA